jgi:hypothetical protein
MSTFSKLAGVALLSVAITGSMVFAGDEDSKSACKKKCAKARRAKEHSAEERPDALQNFSLTPNSEPRTPNSQACSSLA